MNRRGFFGAMVAGLVGAAVSVFRAPGANASVSIATVELIELDIESTSSFWIDVPTANPGEFWSVPVTDLADPAVAQEVEEAVRAVGDPALLDAFSNVMEAVQELHSVNRAYAPLAASEID